MKTIRVLVADDHAIVRAGLRALLESAGDMVVVGEAENGQQAVREVERLRPDVVVLDLAMPRLNGVGAARQLAKRVPSARLLVLSSYTDAQHLREAIGAGAAGYLNKESAAEDLLEAIRQMHKGGAYFSPAVLHCLMDKRGENLPERIGTPTATPTLTQRQSEVLQLIAEGYCNKQVAALLFLSIKTVEKHREHLMLKLNIRKTAGLTRYAISSGVVEVSRLITGQRSEGLRACNQVRGNRPRCQHTWLRGGNAPRLTPQYHPAASGL